METFKYLIIIIPVAIITSINNNTIPLLEADKITFIVKNANRKILETTPDFFRGFGGWKSKMISPKKMGIDAKLLSISSVSPFFPI